MILLLLGAPGSGKGTISNVLIDKFNFEHISTGDLLRAEVASGSQLGKEIDAIMKSGKFVSADLVNNLVKTYLNKYTADGKSVILDGYPRNVEQAKYLDTYTKIDAVAELVVDKELLINRVVGRWNCNKCGAGYNVLTTADYMPNEKDGKYFCKKCGAELVHRADDNKETIAKRLETYEEQTLPLVDFYKNKGILTTYDATANTQDLAKKIANK